LCIYQACSTKSQEFREFSALLLPQASDFRTFCAELFASKPTFSHTMASLEKERSTESQVGAAHVEDATRVQSRSPSEKGELGALEAQTPNAQNKVSLKQATTEQIGCLS
jgi:hypothetical protein